MTTPKICFERLEFFRGPNCWLALVAQPNEVELGGPYPLPFALCVPACQVEGHLRNLHPDARITFLEDAPLSL